MTHMHDRNIKTATRDMDELIKELPSMPIKDRLDCLEVVVKHVDIENCNSDGGCQQKGECPVLKLFNDLVSRGVVKSKLVINMKLGDSKDYVNAFIKFCNAEGFSSIQTDTVGIKRTVWIFTTAFKTGMGPLGDLIREEGIYTIMRAAVGLGRMFSEKPEYVEKFYQQQLEKYGTHTSYHLDSNEYVRQEKMKQKEAKRDFEHKLGI